MLGVPHQQFLAGGFLTPKTPFWLMCTPNAELSVLYVQQRQMAVLVCRFEKRHCGNQEADTC